MNPRPPLSVLRLLLVGLGFALLQASCARSPQEVPEASFEFGERYFRTYCIETECPAPLATCPGDRGLCTTNLSNDIEHCGACDTRCPPPPPGMNATTLCSDGECRFACGPLWADCNGAREDGCETSTSSDATNCGTCGNACDEGSICWRGACGCPNGFTQCGDDCKDLQSDNDNCGACGTKCQEPTSELDPRWTCGPKVTPQNTEWSCVSAECSLQCKPRYGDCNDDFCGDGCETDLRDDPNNCGACGNVCAEGQTCSFGTCLCPPGTTRCFGQCVDLTTDPENCGACGYGCPGPPSTSGTGSPLCEGGKCSYVCFPGFADCDKRIMNGCEANLMTSQKTCGGCDVECDIPAGQPCVAGTCLIKPCEEPVIR